MLRPYLRRFHPHSPEESWLARPRRSFRLGRLPHLQLYAEDFVYKAAYAPNTSGGGFSAVDKQLNDVHLSVGIGIPLLGLGGGGQPGR